MQFRGYMPGYYYGGDHNGGSSGCSWSLYNHDVTSQCGKDSGFWSSPFTMDQYLGFEKEALKQTMLKHEAIFRAQVQELHHIYRRQRELMNDIRERESCDYHLQASRPESNPYLHQIQFDISREILHKPSWLSREPTDYKLPAVTSGNYLGSPPCVTEEDPIAGPGPSVTKSRCREQEDLMSVRARYMETSFDLELPPDAHSDGEEWSRFEEKNVSGAHQELSQFGPPRDLKLDTFNTENSSSTSASCERVKCFFDLNEPVQPESTTSSSGGHREDNAGHMDFMDHDQDICVDKKTEVLSEIIHGVHKETEVNACANALQPDKCRKQELQPGTFSSSSSTLPKLVPPSDEAKSEVPLSGSGRISACKLRHNPIVVQALPCFGNAASLNRSKSSVGSSAVNQDKLLLHRTPTCASGVGSISRCSKPNTEKLFKARQCGHEKSYKDSDSTSSLGAIDLNSMPSEIMKDGDVESKLEHSDEWWHCQSQAPNSKAECADPSSPHSDTESSQKKEHVDKGIDRTSSMGKTCIDLNCGIKEDDPSIMGSTPKVGTTSAAEIDLVAPVSPQNKERSPPRGKSEDNKVDTPIRSSEQYGVSQEELDKFAAEAIIMMSSSRLPEYSRPITSELLEKTSDCLYWFAGVVTSAGSNPHGKQCRIVKKMNLTADKLDCCPKAEHQKESTHSTLLGWANGGRVKAWSCKKFQEGILSSLSSLSLHELTKGLQVNDRPCKRSPRRKNAGRNTSTRQKTCPKLCPSNAMKKTLSSILEELTADGRKQGDLSRYLTGWGNTRKRPRCRRAQVK